LKSFAEKLILLRIPDDKVNKQHAEHTNKAEKVSPSGKNKMKVYPGYRKWITGFLL